MKIVVIGSTRHIRTATVERLRQNGFEAVAASPHRSFANLSGAPRDPGYSGRPLREFLENTASGLRAFWSGRHHWRSRLKRSAAGQQVRGQRQAQLDDGAG